MGKLGVLTSAKQWINELITIKTKNRTYEVQVIEYTDDQSSFKPLPFDKVEEDLDDKNDDEDGVSDTWIQEKDNDEEEGEFRLDNPVPESNTTTDTTTTQKCNEYRGEIGGGFPIPDSLSVNHKATINAVAPTTVEKSHLISPKPHKSHQNHTLTL